MQFATVQLFSVILFAERVRAVKGLKKERRSPLYGNRVRNPA